MDQYCLHEVPDKRCFEILCLICVYIDCCVHNLVNRVKACLEIFPDLINTTSNEGINGLAIAASRGHSDLCDLLLTQDKIDINFATARFPYNALMMSCCNGHAEITRKLIQAGAELNIQNYLGETAANRAVFNDEMACIDVLAEYDDTDWNLTDEDGDSVTMIAIHKNLVEILRRLTTIDSIDWNIRNNESESTLTKALAHENKDFIKIVLSVPTIVYDNGYLRRMKVYDKAVTECQKYLVELSEVTENGSLESLVMFAIDIGLENMAKFIG